MNGPCNVFLLTRQKKLERHCKIVGMPIKDEPAATSFRIPKLVDFGATWSTNEPSNCFGVSNIRKLIEVCTSYISSKTAPYV
jgi:hypothetical protein